MSSFVDISSTIWKSETYTGGFGPSVGVCGRLRRALASPSDQLALKRMAPINRRRASVFINAGFPLRPQSQSTEKRAQRTCQKIRGAIAKMAPPEISSSERDELVRLSRGAHGDRQRGLLNSEHVRARLVPFPKRQTLASKHTPDASRIPPQDFFKHRNEHAHGVVAQHRPPSYLGYVHRFGNSDSQSIVMINVHH